MSKQYNCSCYQVTIWDWEGEPDTYLGPVQPIVVPRPPFSLSTASLSRRLLILAGSTCFVHQYHQNSDKSITATNLVCIMKGSKIQTPWMTTERDHATAKGKRNQIQSLLSSPL